MNKINHTLYFHIKLINISYHSKISENRNTTTIFGENSTLAKRVCVKLSRRTFQVLGVDLKAYYGGQSDAREIIESVNANAFCLSGETKR